MKKIALIFMISMILTGCITLPPSNINDACVIAKTYPSWYYDSLDSYKKWGIPISTQWAFIYKESSFIANAKRPMQYFLGFIPIGRDSSAYGYTQALDGTWAHFKQSTNQPNASRTDFTDSVNFIGWYGDQAARQLHLSKRDTYRLYLAYHEGINNYRNKTYDDNQALIAYARSVQTLQKNYAHQLKTCNIPKKRWWW